MWREIQITAKKKPVIASMSDVAASGGYYMAMGCNKIVAQPNTITGSIGIFGLIFNVTDLMNNKLGVTFDGVGTNPHADWPTATREMTDFEKSMIQKGVNEGYEKFTAKAAAGRKMPVEKLKSLAQGRVWSGIEAKSNGLVDELGGVDAAIKIAAASANLTEGKYRVNYYPEKKKPLDEIFAKVMGDEEEKVLSRNFGEMASYLKMYKKLMNMGGTQTRMPFELVIK
jgi:protease-4